MGGRDSQRRAKTAFSPHMKQKKTNEGIKCRRLTPAAAIQLQITVSERIAARPAASSKPLASKSRCLSSFLLKNAGQPQTIKTENLQDNHGGPILRGPIHHMCAEGVLAHKGIRWLLLLLDRSLLLSLPPLPKKYEMSQLVSSKLDAVEGWTSALAPIAVLVDSKE